MWTQLGLMQEYLYTWNFISEAFLDLSYLDRMCYQSSSVLIQWQITVSKVVTCRRALQKHDKLKVIMLKRPRNLPVNKQADDLWLSSVHYFRFSYFRTNAVLPPRRARQTICAWNDRCGPLLNFTRGNAESKYEKLLKATCLHKRFLYEISSVLHL